MEVLYQASYGKYGIPLYCVSGESTANGSLPWGSDTRDDRLLSLEIDIEVFGDTFLPAYLEGDNSQVVATDSMKNIVLREAQGFAGCTVEGLLQYLGEHFLMTYPQMEALRLVARERPLAGVHTTHGLNTLGRRDALSGSSIGGRGVASLDLRRGRYQVLMTDHQSGCVDLRFLKANGSAFAGFVRDEYTTLPEKSKRLLVMYLDVFWKYWNELDMLGPERGGYVSCDQVRAVVGRVVEEFDSKSIQHLVHEIGRRMLYCFPQLSEVSFAAQNRTPDEVAGGSGESEWQVYSAPFPAYGLIKLTLSRASVHTAADAPGQTCGLEAV